MKKYFVLIPVILLYFVTAAYAEHKLLITDVLGPSEVQAESDFWYMHGSADFTFLPPQVLAPGPGGNSFVVVTPPRVTGKETGNFLGSVYSLGLGIGHGIQLDASIPYDFSDRSEFTYDPPISLTHSFKGEGWGDLSLGAKYGLLGDAKKSFAVVTGVNVKLYTASTKHLGTGTTDVNPYIAASIVVNGNIRPYAAYSPVFRNNGEADSHIITAGVEYAINKMIALRPEFSATFTTGSDTLTAYDSYQFQVESYVQVFRNFYLIPSAQVGWDSSDDSRNGQYDYGTTTFYGGGLSLYYYFNNCRIKRMHGV